jgi:hypothetical protein
MFNGLIAWIAQSTVIERGPGMAIFEIDLVK